MFPESHVSFATGLLEPFKLFRLPRIVTAMGDGVDEILRKHEGDPFPVDAKLLLVVSQEVTKVNVEDLTVLIDHDVVRMSVPDAQDEGGHTVASTAVSEGLYGLLQLVLVTVRGSVVVSDPLEQL